VTHHFITGVAGFIGSQLADALIAAGDKVSGIDDLSLGRREHLAGAEATGALVFIEGDVSDPVAASAAMEAAAVWGGPIDRVWHLAANSDIAAGVNDGAVDFNRTLKTTFGTLQAARAAGVRQIAFASTSAIYGERPDLLTEDSGPLLPISNYGATKLASEALLSAAAEAWLDHIWIFRFPNVVGPRATHGAIFDFVNRLVVEPTELRVLGDGSQAKPYLHVSELIHAMQFIVSEARAKRNVFNIGPRDGETTRVSFMAEQVVARLIPSAAITYAGGDRGWVGDVPRFSYSTDRLAQLGWSPKLSSSDAVIRAVEDIVSALDR
jgi:UDP-glucose 4-epimerase